MSVGNAAEVAIVGGGPAGAALAIRLARRGIETVVFERLARPRWRAAGVYSSPLTRSRLADLGLDPAQIERLIRPIAAMVLRTHDGRASCRLEYPEPLHACGLDRVRLEQALLDHARRAGAEVREGAIVRAVELGTRRPRLQVSQALSTDSWSAALVVGADGPSSLVARAGAVAQPTRRFRRAGLTVHRADPEARPAGVAMDAEMVIGDGWYLGIAPVPDNRVNLGLVLGEPELRAGLSAEDSATAVLARTIARLPGPERPWTSAPATDDLRIALPLAHRVRRAAGSDFLLIGDASGFIDPLSGEGLQRAFASAAQAERAISRWSRGDQTALTDYDRHLRARFRSKDVLSWLLQAFLASPPLTAHALRSLERQPDLRRTFAMAMADLAPASRALDPRFIGRLLLA